MYIFIQDSPEGLFVMQLQDDTLHTAAGPFAESQVAWSRAEQLAHKAGGNAVYTVLPDIAQQVIFGKSGERNFSRACWKVD